MRKPGEVFERDGEHFVMSDAGIAIQVTQRRALNQLSIGGSDNYAEIMLDEWELSPELSKVLRPHIPNPRDMLNELRRHVPLLVELMPDAMQGRMFVDEKEQIFKREKFYIRAFISGGAVRKADKCNYTVEVDSVRRACFGAARLLGEHITQRVDLLRAKSGRADEPMCVRFVTDPLGLHHGFESEAFASNDHSFDRVAMRFRSYFCVTSAHDRDWAAEYNKRWG